LLGLYFYGILDPSAVQDYTKFPSLNVIFQLVIDINGLNESSSFETKEERTRNDLPVTHDVFRRKYFMKDLSCKVQIPPLLRQRHNAAVGSS